MREREYKFIVGWDAVLPAPEELCRGLGQVEMDEVDQLAVYFDTSDLRLTRAGASLRYRSDDGWAVKLPESTGSMLVRRELSFSGDDGDGPPQEAIDFVRALARSAPLAPVARISTHRRRCFLDDRLGVRVGEIDDDVVTGTARESDGVRFREVEFEVADDANPECVAKVLKRLHAAGAVAVNRSKISRVLGEAAELPPDLRPTAPLDSGATVADLARAVLTSGAQRLIDADPVVRAGEDPEGVHQARVATRRLRSDVRTLRPVLDRKWGDHVRGELHWIGGLLGRVRDADVLAELVAEHARALRPGRHARVTSLIRDIEAQRADDRNALLEAMSSMRYTALLDVVTEAARVPPLRVRQNPGQATVDDAAARLIRKPWRRLRAEARRMPANEPDQELHEVRKRAKHVRYALEAVAPVIGKRASRAAERLAALQDTLGDHQDAVIAAGWMERAALESDDVETAFVAGELTEMFAADRRRLRSEWHEQWKQARRAYRAGRW